MQGYNKLCKSQSDIHPITLSVRFLPLLNCILTEYIVSVLSKIDVKAPIKPITVHEYIWPEHVMVRLLKNPQVSKYEPSFKVVVSKWFSTELQVTMKGIHSPEYKEQHMMYFWSFLGVVWVLPMTIVSTRLRWPKSSFGLSVYVIWKCVKTIGLGLKHQCTC